MDVYRLVIFIWALVDMWLYGTIIIMVHSIKKIMKGEKDVH